MDTEARQRFERLRPLLACPGCRGTLQGERDALSCPHCQRYFPLLEDTPRLSPSSPTSPTQDSRDRVARDRYRRGLRSRIRLHPRLYRLAFRAFAPVLVTGPDGAQRLSSRAESGLVLDVGSGNDRRHPRFINVDALPYPEADLVADAETLPLSDHSVAGILSIALLEHVPRPDRLIDEAHRVLQPGGRIFLVAPFLQPFHAAPHDFRRWTIPGLESEITRDGHFRVLESGVYCGPASALAWLLAEWTALVLSGGRPTLRRVLSPLLQVAFSPIKWLDLVLARLPGARDLASVVFADAEKLPPPPAS